MKDWLAKLAEVPKSKEQVLQEKIESFPAHELNELLWDLDPSLRPTQMETMQDKIANAERMGREIAQEREMQKQAFLPALVAGAGRLLAGQGVKSAIGGAAKEAVKGAVTTGASRAISGAVQAPSMGGMGSPGGFSYGKVAGFNLGGLAQRAAGYAVRNPGTAATAAGAVGGALMAPRDPQTGQKQYMRGAVMGGGLAAGANALSNGAIGNKMRSAVMNRESPVLGQKARSYMMDSARATKGSYGKTPAAPGATGASAAPSFVSTPEAATYGGGPITSSSAVGRPQTWMSRIKSQFASPASVAGEGATAAGHYAGGPMMGNVKVASPAGLILRAALLDKVANQQTLIYDPATKTFTRQHMTADMSAGNTGSDVIPAGHTEPVMRGAAGRGQYAGQMAPGALPTGGMAQAHSLHGGDVMSSSPARGMAARPAAVPPPIPAAARAGGVAGLAGAAAKPKLPSLAGAMSLARK
jgi:hypothetical protein